MKSLGPALTLLIAAVSYGDVPELAARFSTALVTIEPGEDSSRRITLPGLEFGYAVEMNCGAASKASRVSVSIADTRQSFDVTATDDRRLKASIVIPAEQIAPVATQGFCVLDEPDSRTSVIVSGVLTSQVSLLCSSETEGAMHFVSQPLAVRLVCNGSSTDQVPFSTVR